MKAVTVHEFGGLDHMCFEDVPLPVASREHVVVRVGAAGVGNWDALVREGKSGLGQHLPLILGADLSGTITEIGDGVSGFESMEQVYGATNSLFTGAYAEYALCDARMIAPMPKSLTLTEAASVPVVGVTALQMVREYGMITPGQRVLVHGAAGNVGAYAVQLAKLSGANVIAHGFAEDEPYLAHFHVDRFIDAGREAFDDLRDIDVVLDTIGGDVIKRSFAVLRPGGILVSSVAEPPQDVAADLGVRAAFFIVNVTTARLQELTRLFDDGSLETHVGEQLPLHCASEAHAMLAGKPHRPGRIVLTT